MPKLFDFATSLDDVCQLQLVRASLSLSPSLSLAGMTRPASRLTETPKCNFPPETKGAKQTQHGKAI